MILTPMYQNVSHVKRSDESDLNIVLDLEVVQATGRINLATGKAPANYDVRNIAVPSDIIKELQDQVYEAASHLYSPEAQEDDQNVHIRITHWTNFRLDYIYRGDIGMHVLIATDCHGAQYTVNLDTIQFTKCDFTFIWLDNHKN